MKKRTVFLSICVLAIAAYAIHTIVKKSPAQSINGLIPAVKALPGDATFADKQLQRAEQVIKRAPQKSEGYNLLASAFLMKARETGDFGFNAKADAAINRSLELIEDNFDALQLKALLLVTYHQFHEAIVAARKAQQVRQNMPDSYIALIDALNEIGDYPAALDAAQKLMDLRPDAISYSQASRLRALYGDTPGAIEAMQTALRSADARNPESTAWYQLQLANQLLNAGKPDEAEKTIDAALQTFPSYHLALAAKAHARMLANDTNLAIQYYDKALQRVPLGSTAIALGDLYTKLGRAEEAKRQYELAALVENPATQNPACLSQQMAIFYAERGEKFTESINCLRQERALRSDIYTADALAWVLFKSGNSQEAKQYIDEALRLNTRDARIHYHAGIIYRALGNRLKALSHLKIALDTRSAFDNNNTIFGILQIEHAKQALQELGNPK